MKREFGEYKRLARGTFSCSSLWEGAEHLLYVRGSGLIMPIYEEYRRIRYSEIEAVTVARTRGWVVTSVLAGLVLALFGIPAMLLAVKLGTGAFDATGEMEFTVVSMVLSAAVAAAAAALLGWNLVRGPTCHCGIQTPAGVVRVRPAGRLRVAGRVAEAVARRVEVAQGGPRAQAQAGGALGAGGSAGGAGVGVGAPGAPPPPPPPPPVG